MDDVRIKKGKIVFGSDRLMLEETFSGHISNILDMWREGGRDERIAFSVTAFVFFFSLSSIVNFLILGSPIQIGFFGILMMSALMLAWIHKLENGFTNEKFIQKSEINSVDFNPGMKWVTCPRFIINYQEDGEEKKRYVIMPTHLIPGVDRDIEEMKHKFENLDIDFGW